MTRHGLHVCFSLFPKEEVYVVYTLQCYMGGKFFLIEKLYPCVMIACDYLSVIIQNSEADVPERVAAQLWPS